MNLFFFNFINSENLVSSFEASNGIKQQNTGFLKSVLIPQTREDGTETGEKVEGNILVQTGSYSFTGNSKKQFFSTFSFKFAFYLEQAMMV